MFFLNLYEYFLIGEASDGSMRLENVPRILAPTCRAGLELPAIQFHWEQVLSHGQDRVWCWLLTSCGAGVKLGKHVLFHTIPLIPKQPLAGRHIILILNRFKTPGQFAQTWVC